MNQILGPSQDFVKMSRRDDGGFADGYSLLLSVVSCWPGGVSTSKQKTFDKQFLKFHALSRTTDFSILSIQLSLWLPSTNFDQVSVPQISFFI